MRQLLDGADYRGLFLELGWDNPPDTAPVYVGDARLDARRVADKKGGRCGWWYVRHRRTLGNGGVYPSK